VHTDYKKRRRHIEALRSRRKPSRLCLLQQVTRRQLSLLLGSARNKWRQYTVTTGILSVPCFFVAETKSCGCRYDFMRALHNCTTHTSIRVILLRKYWHEFQLNFVLVAYTVSCGANLILIRVCSCPQISRTPPDRPCGPPGLL
jgi:hypothetical protein